MSFADLQLTANGRVLSRKSAKVMYIMYLFVGGLFFEKVLPLKWMLIYYFVHLVNFLLFTVYLTSYMVRNLDLDFATAIYYSIICNANYCIFFLYAVIFLAKDRLKEFIVNCDNHFNLQLSGEGSNWIPQPHLKRMAVSNVLLIEGTVLITSYLFFVLSRPAQLLYKSEKDYNSIYIQVYPIPSFGHSLNVYSFTVISTIQVILGFVPIAVPCVVQPIFVAIVVSIYDAVEDLAYAMEKDSEDYLANWMNNSMTNDSEEERKYLEKFKIYSADYKLLISHFERIRPFLEFVGSYFIIQGVLVITTQMFSLVLAGETYPVGFLVGQAGLLGLITTVLFSSIYFGAFCEEMNEIMMREAYNVPWFAISPRNRIIPLNLLIQLQQPLFLFVVKIFPIKLRMFPKILNTDYAIVNVLRVRKN